MNRKSAESMLDAYLEKWLSPKERAEALRILAEATYQAWSEGHTHGFSAAMKSITERDIRPVHEARQ